jgi:hypothetical protein
LTEIELGTLVLLNKNERAPVDLLVICAEQSLFSVDYNRVDGRMTEQPKRVLRLLEQKVLFDQGLLQTTELKRLICGQISLLDYGEWGQERVGILRLKNDPVPEPFGLGSVIENGGIIRHTEWVVGLTIRIRQTWPLHRNRL